MIIIFFYSVNNFIYLYHSFFKLKYKYLFIYKYYIKFDHDVVKKKKKTLFAYEKFFIEKCSFTLQRQYTFVYLTL